MDDGLKNLIFLVVALLAWGIKAAMERKRGRAQSGGRSPAGGTTPSQGELSTGEVDVVYGRRRLPPQITAAPTSLAGSGLSHGRAASPEAVPAGSGRAGVAPADRPRHSASADTNRLQTTVHKRTLKTDLQVTGPQGTTVHPGSLRAERAWQRLGVDRTRGARRALRSAVLWREVLGPPRALRGPHRPPSRSRRP